MRPSREGAGGRGCFGAARLGTSTSGGAYKFEQAVYEVEVSFS